MLQITENVYGIMTMMSNVNMYLIANGDDVTVIDAGLGAGSVNAIEKGLQSKGWSWEQVKHIFITHAHPDHIGGLKDLQARCNATTYAHRLDTPIIRGLEAAAAPDPSELGFFGRMMQRVAQNSDNAVPCRVDVELNGDETLDAMLSGTQVIHLPGHSYGQVGLWLPEDRLLIGGDVMMNFMRLSMPFRMVSPDWNAVKASIRVVYDLNPKILCLGHGRVIQGDIQSKIRRFDFIT